MNRKEKLITRFLSMPSDFRYDEMVKLLGYFEQVKKGKTSGSRMKHYQLKQIKEALGL